MKSEERHDMKTNVLADWIANFPEWAKENTGTIAYVAIIIIIVGVAAYFKWYRPAHAISQEQLEMSQLDGQLEMTKLRLVSVKSQTPQGTEMIRSIADRLKAIAGRLSGPEQAAFALIKQGEALRAELHFGSADFAQDPNALEFQINQARTCYRQAAEKAGDNAELAAAAQFGLGLCEEEIGKFDEAQKIYHDIIKNEKYIATAAMPLAKARIADMGDYKGKFVFVETKPAEAMPSGPLGPRIQNAPTKAPMMKPAPKAPAPAPAKPAETNAPAAK